MAEDPKNENAPIILESFWKLLDSKLISLGIPGALIGVALDFARKKEWQNAGLCVGAAGAFWLIIKVGNELSPYIDKFLDWILVTQIPKWWTIVTDRFGAEYLARLIAECKEYQGRGFSGEGLDLENVFVPLGFNSETPVSNPQDLTDGDQTEQTETSITITTHQESEIGSLLKGITKKNSTWRRLVILGAPGSGKTTLLRHITLLLALRKQSKLCRGLPQLIPILLRLRDVAPAIVADANSSLAQVIAKAMGDESPKTQEWFNKQLKDAKCLVMLDGLDEVADDEHRRQVSTWVSQQLQNYRHKLPFILTSRPQAYNQAPLPNTPAYFVRSFTTEQRNSFLFNWYFNLEKRKNSGEQSQKQLKKIAESKQNELVRQIDGVHSLRLMATNPLLLALIINTYKEKTSLSPTRIGIYKQVCDLLLQGRQSASGTTRTTRYPLKPEQKQEALQALALEMTKRQVLQFTLDERNQDGNIFLAKEFLQRELAQMVEGGQELKPEDFIERDDSGVRELLSDRKQEKLYEFTHRTFQEYLTAVELTKAEHESYLLEVFTKDKQYLDWRRQTILFYAGQVKVDKLIDAALNNPTVATLTLAYECLQNKLRVSREKEQELLNKVEQGLNSDDVEVFKLAASVQLEKRLNHLNEDCFVGSSEKEDHSAITTTKAGDKIWAGQVVDNTEITEAEYRLFLLETTNSDLTLEIKPGEINFAQGNAFCAWLSERTRERFSDAGICYRRETSTDKFCLVRFRIPEKYHQLAYYLAAGMWEEADEETFKVMLEEAGQEKQGYLDIEDIREFPCEDLRIIDKLWVDYSDGHFGFSVQKEIYLSVGGILEGNRTSSPFRKVLAPIKSIYVRFGGRVRDDDVGILEAFCRFGDEVGWRVDDEFIGMSKIKYDTSGEQGHLPSLMKYY
ncbi:GUN4 domain-containing protein [Nostoc sp. CCCryo 231-06]|nr:GUN4 domain-containing protein [Nostoc sp. CCCryo 231-06]